jgi:hypothetical protein
MTAYKVAKVLFIINLLLAGGFTVITIFFEVQFMLGIILCGVFATFWHFIAELSKKKGL